MKDITLNPALASATLGKSPPRQRDAGASDENAQNWQREMERMQAQAWLAHPIVGYTALATSPGHNAITAPAASLIVQQAGASPGTQASQPATSHAPPASAAAEGGAPSRGPGRGPSRSEQAQEQGQDLVNHGESRASRAVAAAEASATSSIEHHAVGAPTPAEEPGAPPQLAACVTAPVLDARALAQSLGAFGNAQVTVTSAAAPLANAAPHPVVAATSRGPMQEPLGGELLPIAQPIAGRSTRAAPLAKSKARPSLPPAPEAQPGIRVHAEWSSDGVRLWLGMDNGTQENAAPIAAHLQQWLSNQGHRTLSVICNGRQMLSYTRQRREDDAPLQPYTCFSTEA